MRNCSLMTSVWLLESTAFEQGTASMVTQGGPMLVGRVAHERLRGEGGRVGFP